MYATNGDHIVPPCLSKMSPGLCCMANAAFCSRNGSTRHLHCDIELCLVHQVHSRWIRLLHHIVRSRRFATSSIRSTCVQNQQSFICWLLLQTSLMTAQCSKLPASAYVQASAELPMIHHVLRTEQPLRVVLQRSRRISLGFTVAYALWVLLCAKVDGKFLYPFLNTYPFPQVRAQCPQHFLMPSSVFMAICMA